MQIENFIKLVVPQSLEDSQVKDFYNLVYKHLSDIIQTYRGYKVIHQKSGRSHLYVIPLERDLEEYEAAFVVENWDEKFDGSYYIETSTTEDEEYIEDLVDDLEDEVEKDLELAMQKQEPNLLDSDSFGIDILKQMHHSWFEELTDLGWRYGTEYNADEKTHPMLLPWEQLPGHQGTVDADIVTRFMQALRDLDLKLCKKS